ncbi:MAG TPA: hypothetical protein VMA09_12300 [Candidatus Binataceae bacterium]|nr:hypothetical protein [Candidatus Binataceae bacterium]
MHRPHERAGFGRPLFFLLLIAALAASACYSRDYNQAVAANVSLISDLCDKLADYSKADFMLDDHKVTSEEMGEFYYAFNKASAFSASTPREASRHSHKDFDKMLVAYENFVHAADEYRLRTEPDAAALAGLMSQRDQVKHLAGRVTQDLHDEAKS